MKKKNYNPFKMWGSYVGAYLTPATFVLMDEINMAPANALVKSIFWVVTPGFFGSSKEIMVTMIAIGGGFLIGWGIHSLFRRFRK